MTDVAILRKALEDLLKVAPSGDDLALLCVAVNGSAMTMPTENGQALRDQCEGLTAARARALAVLKETDPATLPKGMSTKRLAFTAVIEEDGARLGIAEEGEPGYLPQRAPGPIPYQLYLNNGTMDATGRFKDYGTAKKVALELNERLFGLNALESWKIAMSSMRSGMR